MDSKGMGGFDCCAGSWHVSIIMAVRFVIAIGFRWRFQFSIRSLMFLTLAVAIPASWLAVEMKWVREQREAVAAIEKLGGGVKYDYVFSGPCERFQWLSFYRIAILKDCYPF
jgi:hypothetical protein